jgi:ATP-binding cassette subfamily B protein
MVQEIVDALATTVARLEEAAYSNAVILPNFPRSLQLDYYSCGAKSVYTILKYFGKQCTPLSIERQLGTTWEGTSRRDIRRVLQRHGLKCRTISNLKSAIDDGYPVLVSTHDRWHYSVVYGSSSSAFFVMNPSLGAMGSLRCAVSKKEFRRVWDRWALEVR